MRRTLQKWSMTLTLVATPFDCQPVRIPTPTAVEAVQQGILGSSAEDRRREDEVQLLLRHLPHACDKAKSNLVQARRASQYYRQRYGRGCEAERNHAENILRNSNDDAGRWAAARSCPIHHPLPSW